MLGAKLLCLAGDEEAAPQTSRAAGGGKAAIVQGCPFKRCPCPWKHFQQQRWEQAERGGGRAGPRGFPIKARTCSPPWDLHQPPSEPFSPFPCTQAEENEQPVRVLERQRVQML